MSFIRRLSKENFLIDADSIFKYCSRTFYQLYIIHVVESELVMIDCEYAAHCAITSILVNICIKWFNFYFRRASWKNIYND
ncbi:hypothetical protein MXB_2116 [Myxobolus squamalis]|nr:hypothetical protein MXB_2116 [Myxobolus squamalis]